MKKIITSGIAICLSLLATSVYSQNYISGNKNYETKTVNVESFTGITVNGSPDVIYTQAEGSPSVEIYASSNIIPVIETFVENGKLVVQYKKNTKLRNPGKIEIRVSAPALTEFKVHGSGDIYLKNGINSREDLNIYVHGSGDIKGKNIRCNGLKVNVHGSGDVSLSNVNNNSCEVKVHGSGDIELSGTTVNADYNVHGSGDIEAVKLKAENVTAYIYGSGDIKCHAEKKLTGKVNGSGDVGYKGNPEIDFSKKGLHKL